MKRLLTLRRDNRGAGAVEFALAVPALLTLIIGITQLGILYFANADLRNAVAAGARYASIYPRPSDTAVVQRINGKVVGLEQRYITAPTITHGTDASGNTYADITMKYDVPLNFIFVKTPAVKLTETRRVFTQPTT